jgi:hypothetical protein
MTKATTLTLCILGGFSLQITILEMIALHGLPEPWANTLGPLLLPGVAILWSEGIHTGSGFGLAMAVNTAYYALLLLGAVSLLRRLRSHRGQVR